MNQKSPSPSEITATKVTKIKNELIPLETIQTTSLLFSKKRKGKPDFKSTN